MKKFRPKRQDIDSDYENERLKQEKPVGQPALDDLSVSLRAEMLPASDLRPDFRKFRSFKLNPFTVGAVLLLLIFLFLGWFLYFGPGRPALDAALASLVQKIQPESSATPMPTLEVEAPQTTAAEAPIIASTLTPTVRVLPSATATILLATPTHEPSATAIDQCVDVLSITLEDVGKTLCIRGVILNFEERPSGFLIAFSAQKGSMYWVSYDLVWKPAEEGLCVETSGEVQQIADTPVLVFGYQNLPQICSTP